MSNRLSHRAPSLFRNQAGNSSASYLIVAVVVGIAGVSAVTAFGGASGLAIADKAASAASAVPDIGGHGAAAEGEPDMQVGIAPSELGDGQPGAAGSTNQGAAGDGANGGEITLDEDGTIRDAAGNALGVMDEQGVISVDGVPVAQVNPDGTISELALPEDGAAGGMVASSQASESGRAEEASASDSEAASSSSGKDGGGKLGFWGKIVTGGALLVGGLAVAGAAVLGAITAPAWVPVLAVAAAGVGALGLYETFTGKDHADTPAIEAPAEEVPSEEIPTEEVAPESGALDGQAPLMSLESLGLTNLVDPPYQFEEGMLTSDASSYVFQQLGLSLEQATSMGENSEYYRNRSFPVTYADGSTAFVSLQLSPASEDGTTWTGMAVVTDEQGNELGVVPMRSESSSDFTSTKIDMFDVNEDGSLGDSSTIVDARFEREGGEGFFVFRSAQGEEQRSEAYPVDQGYENMTEYLVHENFAMMLAAQVKPNVEIEAVGELQETFEVSEMVNGKKQTLLLDYTENGTSIISIDRNNGHVGEWLFERTGDEDAEGFPIEKLVSVRAAKMPQQ